MLNIVHSGWSAVGYETQKEISKDFISEQIRDDYLKHLTTPGSVRTEGIANLSSNERLQIIFDLVQSELYLLDNYRLQTASEIFFCLAEIDDYEDIKKLKPDKRVHLLLRKSADLAVEEKRPW